MPTSRNAAAGAGFALALVLSGPLAAASSGSGSPGAPGEPVRFEAVSYEEGVSHDLVWCLHEDRRGFVWFGTMYGLFRWDGREYVSIRHDPDDPGSLANDDIVCLDEDARGDLWIGTYGGGVSHWDREGGTFRTYGASRDGLPGLSHGIVWDLAVASDGAVWVATPIGLDRIDPATGAIRHHRHDPDDPGSLGSGPVRALAFDRDGALWVGLEGGGLDRLDPGAETFLHHRAETDAEGALPGDDVSSLLVDGSGRLWIGTRDGGLALLDPGTGSFAIPEVSEESGGILAGEVIHTLASDAQSVLWIGGPRGLLRFDPTTSSLREFRPSPDEPGALPRAQVVAILPDRAGGIWVGTYLGGLVRLPPSGSRFRQFGEELETAGGPRRRDVRALVEDLDGHLWIGTADGLLAREGCDGSLRHFARGPDDSGPRAARIVNCLAVDRSGDLWLGTPAGLGRVPRGGDRIRSWNPDPEDDSAMAPGGVTAIVEEADGKLWVGTGGGLCLFDPATGTFERHLHDPDDEQALPDDTVLSLYRDRPGALWVGTYGGLSRRDPASGRFETFRMDPADPTSLAGNYVYCYLEGTDGTFWIGTASGLHRRREAGPGFDHWTRADGLPNDVIAGILPATDGRLWLSTQRGLVLFDPDTGAVRTFDTRDGLQSNFFRSGSCVRLASGDLVFGGIGGYNVLSPAPPSAREDALPVVLTAVRGPGIEIPRWRDPCTLPSLELGPRQDTFTLAWAAPGARRPGHVRYSYLLEGHDHDWTDGGRRAEVSYTRVHPGRYVFRVRARGDGDEDDPGDGGEGARDADLSLPVRVAPPWWGTTAFRVAALAALGAGLLGLHRLRLHRRLRHALDVERARAEERDLMRRRMAGDFHDELGHRLTKIGLFSDLLRRRLGDAPGEVLGYLDRIVREARCLSDETRDFLWSIGPGDDSLDSLVDHLAEFGRGLFEIEFRVEGRDAVAPGQMLTMGHRRHITSIFKEAMHNSLKHANCSRVTFSVASDGSEFTLSLTDDGRGWEEEPTTPSAGRGLKNMKLRAQRIDGTIRITSRPGSGSTIALTRRARLPSATG